MKQRIINIIAAAGAGSRFGSDLPKQFCLLDNRPVLMRAIECMRQVLPNSGFIVVLNEAFVSYWKKLCADFEFDSPQIAVGGNTRWQSVKNALSLIGEVDDDTIVTVHDGARPIVDSALIERVVNAVGSSSGAIPAIQVTDSLRLLTSDGMSFPVDRSSYRAVQTPQAFNARKMLNAYSMPFSDNFTDDASVMAAAGYEDVALVDGDSRNIKITYSQDIEIASIYLKGILEQ